MAKAGFPARMIVALLAAGLSLGGVARAGAETLADAMANAYDHSGLLEQNRALLRAADENVAVATASLRPILNWSAEVKRSFGRAATASSGGIEFSSASTSVAIGVGAELLIYDFGASKYAISAAKENVLAARSALVSVEQAVLLRAVRAYMNVRRETENVALRQNNVRLITQEFRAAQDRFDVGEVTRTDVAHAEARLAAARSALAAAEGALYAASEEYAAATGHKPGGLKPPAGLPRTAATVEAAKDVAVRSHPDMDRAQHEIAAAELNILRAEAAMKPTVKLTGRVSLEENFNSPNFTKGGEFGLEASGPIYHGGRLSALARQAMANRDAARGALHVTRHTVQQNVANAWAQLLVARAARDASDRQIRAARVAFRGVREEATLGARTTLDVLNAKQELLNAEAGLISAVTDEYIAAYTLLSAMGLLTADHLNLRVQRYDPAEYYNLVKSAPTVSQQGEKLDRVLKKLSGN